MSKKTALVDVDGVLADFVGDFLRLVYDETGAHYEHADVTDFDIGKALGLTPETAAAVKKNIGQGWCSRLEPIAGAVEGFARLSQIADVYIVTSPWNSCATWMSERETWLRRHFGVPHSRVIHGSAKHLVRGDVLVDDKTETIVKWQAAHPDKTAVLWEAPWNRKDAWGGVLTNDWNRLCSLVEAMS